MTYVVRFEDYTPSPRTDQPWTGINVYESASADGPFNVVLDTFAIADDSRMIPQGLDPDPSNPIARSFTTSYAALQFGWYVVEFFDPSSNIVRTDPVFHGGPITPSVSQVAQFLRARTMGAGGQLNTFTAFTDPNIDQVESYIQSAATDVVSKVGRVIPPEASDIARRVIEVNAAMLIEIGSEDINEARYDRLKTLYDERLARLFEAVVEYGGDVIDPIDEDEEGGGAALGTPFPIGLKTGSGWNRDWD
jgi:hypothetical protein